MARGSGVLGVAVVMVTLYVVLLHAPCTVKARGAEEAGDSCETGGHPDSSASGCRGKSPRMSPQRSRRLRPEEAKADWMRRIDITEKGHKLEMNSLFSLEGVDAESCVANACEICTEEIALGFYDVRLHHSMSNGQCFRPAGKAKSLRLRQGKEEAEREIAGCRVHVEAGIHRKLADFPE